MTLTRVQRERRLQERLLKDRAKRSKRIIEVDEEGITVTVEVSNLSYGMAMGIGQTTGEEPMEVVERVMNEFAHDAVEKAIIR